MKRAAFLIMAVIFSVLLLSGCKKEMLSVPSGETTTVNSVNDIQVPADFDWAMTREVNLNLGMNFPANTYTYNVIRIYN